MYDGYAKFIDDITTTNVLDVDASLPTLSIHQEMYMMLMLLYRSYNLHLSSHVAYLYVSTFMLLACIP